MTTLLDSGRLTTAEIEARVSAWAIRERASILAGHFALKECRSAVSGVECTPSVNEGSFGPVTWKMGCRAAHSIGAHASLLVVVNDWDWMRPARRSVQSGNWIEMAVQSRRRFYKGHPRLLPEYESCLYECGCSDAVIEKQSNSQWMFSESDLRDAFSHRAYRLAGSAIDCSRVRVEKGPTPSLMVDTDVGEVCIAVGGSAGCVGTICELVFTLSSRGNKGLAMLIPDSCFTQVDVAWRVLNEIAPDISFSLLCIAFQESARNPEGEYQVIVSEHR